MKQHARHSIGSLARATAEPCRGHSAAARACSLTGAAAAGCSWFPRQGERDRHPDTLLDPQPRAASAPLLPCRICSLSGGRETRESSLMAGKHKENYSTNEGEGRELRALPIKNTGHKRRRARQGGEQGSHMATLPAGTGHVPGCPPRRDRRRGDGEHRAPASTHQHHPALPAQRQMLGPLGRGCSTEGWWHPQHWDPCLDHLSPTDALRTPQCPLFASHVLLRRWLCHVGAQGSPCTPAPRHGLPPTALGAACTPRAS